MKIRTMAVQDGRTEGERERERDKTKLIGAFRNLAKSA